MSTKEEKCCPSWLKQRIIVRRLREMVKSLEPQRIRNSRLHLRYNVLCQFSRTCCWCPLLTKYGCLIKSHPVYWQAEQAYDPRGFNNRIITDYHYNRCKDQVERLHGFLIKALAVIENIEDMEDKREMTIAYWVINEISKASYIKGEQSERSEANQV